MEILSSNVVNTFSIIFIQRFLCTQQEKGIESHGLNWETNISLFPVFLRLLSESFSNTRRENAFSLTFFSRVSNSEFI